MISEEYERAYAEMQNKLGRIVTDLSHEKKVPFFWKFVYRLRDESVEGRISVRNLSRINASGIRRVNRELPSITKQCSELILNFAKEQGVVFTAAYGYTDMYGVIVNCEFAFTDKNTRFPEKDGKLDIPENAAHSIGYRLEVIDEIIESFYREVEKKIARGEEVIR